MIHIERYQSWLESNFIDSVTKNELRGIKEAREIEDRFYKELEFGTGGLRGIIGAGTNRMNVYTVGKATQGLANYLLHKYREKISVSIAYDSRKMSYEFAETVARTLCANGISVYLFESLRPTPMLSYTVRHFKSNAGIVITASHNPKQYNGYKVYGADGGQVTDAAAEEILKCIEAIKDFSQVKNVSLEDAKEKNLLHYIGEDVDNSYMEKVKKCTIREGLVRQRAKDLKIIYTPIHGAGNLPVRRVLNELGYENVMVVREQELPDGEFPTAAYPNPEDPAVFQIALKMAETVQPDIIFGTDPDCDRIGVVVKAGSGTYRVLSGNETGVLLVHYILSSLEELKKLPENGVIVKTIVTTEMASKLAKKYGVELIDVLTGFKYIGEKMKEYEEQGEKKYIFGFEESFGYLVGDFVRDKDAVSAAMLICEMTLYYKDKGMSLYDGLMALYKEYGFYKESLISIELQGKEGQEKIAATLEQLRNSNKSSIGAYKIHKKIDYKNSTENNLMQGVETKINLPKSNVLKFILENGYWFVVRPSGTEPKMKIYLSVIGQNLEDAEVKIEEFKNEIMTMIQTT